MEQSRAHHPQERLEPGAGVHPAAPAKRDAMSALYAFCREVDDVADEEPCRSENAAQQLADWREDIAPRLRQRPAAIRRSTGNCSPSSTGTGCRSSSSTNSSRACEMDLDPSRYATLADLELYCYRVASVVGLLSIEIFGYQDPGLPRLRRSPGQGPAADQHPARRPHRCRARPNLPAPGRTAALRRHPEEILRRRILGALPRPGRRRGRARRGILSPGPRRPCRPGTAAPWLPPN